MTFKQIDIFYGELTDAKKRANDFLSELRDDEVISVDVQDLGLKTIENDPSRLVNIVVVYLKKEKSQEVNYDPEVLKNLVPRKPKN
ncbi:hypothetical protein [Aneurinibacillus terranovensis]|uniref:hypothetical protein n=1 Tax=Aneurinibacillus terranovensis TaxID=278991 RepID=UPI0003F58D1F|nr:hypothetical protein [Aneurinibacillus terranovensis]